MPTVGEASGASEMSGLLGEGVNFLSQNTVLTFTKYVRVVLPLDGFVFWIRSDLTSVVTTGPATLSVQGSLHYSTATDQREEETIAINRVTFTALAEVQDLNEIAGNTIYICNYGEIRFAFSSQGKYYKTADLYHYTGNAVYPVMQPMLIDDITKLDEVSPVISNSLAIWLTLNQFFPLYPSFLVPENIVPPYATVDVKPETTVALQAIPWVDSTDSSSYQLMAEEVKITIYGVRNNSAIDFLNYVIAQTWSDTIGLMNMPALRDEKRTQNELNILAIKKAITFKVSYYQTRINTVAKLYILSCIPTYNPV